MTRNQLLERLDHSETLVDLFLNKHKQSHLVNRVKKFWRQPYKFVYHNAYKLGLHHITDYKMKTFWGDTLVLPLSDENNVTLYYCGSLSESECRLARFFINTVKPGDVFYDVGANFGFFGFLARALGAKEVHLFEPSDVVMRYVRKNAYPDMHLNEVAVADTSGTLEFYDLSPSNKGQMSSLFADFIPEHNRPTQRVLTVQALTLDKYIASHTPPTVIKMDIENSECLALAGATTLLREHSPIIAMECMDTPNHIERTRKALTILKDTGYQAFSITPEGGIIPTSLSHLGQLGEYNEIVFKKVPQESRA